MWAFAFEVSPDDTKSVVASLEKLLSLIDDTKSAVQQVEKINTDLYLDSFPIIEQIVSIDSLSHACNDIQKQLGQPHVLQGIRFCADLLNQFAPESKVDDDTLDQLRQTVETGINEVSKAEDIDPQLRAVLVDQLERVRQSIIDYRLFGIEAVLQAYQGAVGAIAAHQSLMGNNPSENSTVRRYVDAMNDVGEVIDSVDRVGKRSLNLSKTLSAIGKMLPTGRE